MRGTIIIAGGSFLVALVLSLPLQAQEAGEFEWSWEGAETAPTNATDASKPAGTLDPDTYNQLLKENLDLRRQLQETDRGAEAMREENARLNNEMAALQAKISASAEEISRLQRESTGSGDPDKVMALEAELAAAENAKAKLAQELTVLQSRMDRTDSAPPPAVEATVKPGSDLFVALDRENSELRTQLATLETEKQKVMKQLREVSSEADAKSELESEMETVSGETEKQRQLIRKLLERIPQLEADLAETRSRERDQSAELSERERQLRALKAELDRREERVRKAERVVQLLAKTRSEVQVVGSTRQRDMHYNMAVVFANRGQFKEAEREYLRALGIDPADADTHYNLGVLYDQNLKEYRKAASHYRRYLRLRPNAPDANEVRIWITTAETK